MGKNIHSHFEGRVNIAGLSFVDDTDLLHFDIDDHLDEGSPLQDSVDTWQGLIKATCGMLNPVKSTWYDIKFLWSANGVKAYDNSGDVELSMKNHLGMWENLEKRTSSTPTKSLGVWITPDGNEKQQATELHKAAESWRSKLQRKYLPRQQALWPRSITNMKTII